MSPKLQAQIAGYIGAIFVFGPIVVPALRDYFYWSIALGMFIIGIPYLIQVRQSYKLVNEVEERHEEDVTAENYQPTRNATLLIRQLTELGFTRLGETRSPLNGPKHPITWILTNPDHTDFVEVADIGGKMPAMLQFTTVFADEAVLETMYPIGETKDFPQHRFRFNSVSVNAAYDQHALDRFRFESEHGTPRPIKSMADYSYWEGRYRELYGRNKLKGADTRAMLNAALFFGMFGLMFVYALTNSDFIPEGIGMAISAIAVAVLLIVGFMVLIYNRPATKRAAAAEHFKKTQDKATRPRRRIF